MKYFYCLLLLTFTLYVKANHIPTLFDKLNGINACWSEQTDIRPLPIYGTPLKNFTDQQLIQLHLQLVETILRSRNTSGLSEAQKIARFNNLDHLKQYWQINTYPINNKTVKRNPVFIDDYNTFCAVGYLIKTSGHEPLARNIASTQNLFYLRDIKIQGLNQWVSESGLTLDELAWIQPGYMAGNNSRSLGSGVNGPVYALAGDEATNTLYVAGHFSEADNWLACNNIVAVKYDQQTIFTNTFSTLGAGLNGTVRTLYNDGTTLYAGGEFDASGSSIMHNIAKWNGTAWEAMGELNGIVKCIEKFDDKIYVGGEFTYSYNGKNYQNLACWDGTNWKPITEYPIGKVNALKTILNTRLIVGGEFTMIDTLVVNHIFSYANLEITALGNGVPANVNTIDWHGNHCMAAGDFIDKNTDSTFAYAFFNSTENIWNFPYRAGEQDSNEVINSSSNGYVGGQFNASRGMSNWLNTGILTYENGFYSFASTAGEVFSILKLGKRVFFGGNFTEIISVTSPFGGISFHDASNLAVWDPEYVGLKNINESNSSFSISPNPTQSTTFLQTQSAIKSVTIIDISGKLVWENTFEKGLTEFSLDREIFPSTGLYLITLQTTDGDRQNQKLLVE